MSEKLELTIGKVYMKDGDPTDIRRIDVCTPKLREPVITVKCKKEYADILIARIEGRDLRQEIDRLKAENERFSSSIKLAFCAAKEFTHDSDKVLAKVLDRLRAAPDVATPAESREGEK